MDEKTGMQNPLFRIVDNNMKQSGINQMGIGQMNQNMGNSMMNQNNNFMNNPMMNQGNMMQSEMMNMNQGNMMNQMMNMNQGNMMQSQMMNMNQGNMMNQMMDMNQGNMMNQIMNLPNQNNMLNENNSNNPSHSEDNQINSGYISIKFRTSGSGLDKRPFEIQAKLDEKVSEIIQRYRFIANDHELTRKFIFNAKPLNYNLTVAEAGLSNNANIFVVSTKGIKGAGGFMYDKEINIKFIKSSKNSFNKISNCQLDGLLKLCLLKEISSKLNDDKLIKLPEIINYIMRILKKGYIPAGPDIKETIKEVLLKIKGSNIINFSEYVNETIDENQIDKIIKLLDSNDLKEIKDIRFRLSKYNEYMEFFMKEFDKTKKESIFEFSVISLVVMEREDFEKFKKEREKCPNRVDKILYHGTINMGKGFISLIF